MRGTVCGEVEELGDEGDVQVLELVPGVVGPVAGVSAALTGDADSIVDLGAGLRLGEYPAGLGGAAVVRAGAPCHGRDEQLGRRAVLVGVEDELAPDGAVAAVLGLKLVQDGSAGQPVLTPVASPGVRAPLGRLSSPLPKWPCGWRSGCRAGWEGRYCSCLSLRLRSVPCGPVDPAGLPGDLQIPVPALAGKASTGMWRKSGRVHPAIQCSKSTRPSLPMSRSQ